MKRFAFSSLLALAQMTSAQVTSPAGPAGLLDNYRGHPATRGFRIEQDSKDGGTTWVDRLCLFEPGVGDVCYNGECVPHALKHEMTHISRAARFAIAVGLLIVEGSALLAQSSAAGRGGGVIGTGVFTSFVENMDRSLAFYHDVFDMDVPPIPASGERP